jgi:hypothetical protein
VCEICVPVRFGSHDGDDDWEPLMRAEESVDVFVRAAPCSVNDTTTKQVN